MLSARGAVRRGRRASGAIAAQLVQALTSFILHVAAVRALGVEGLGVFALLFSGLILATAVSSGLVGDSLTVLDRSRDQLRAGLQAVALAVAAIAAGGGAAAVWAAGLLTLQSALVFAAVIALFMFEDLIRRLLMATLRFWSVVAVDVAALLTTVSWLTVTAAAVRPLELADLLLALLASQVIGLAVGIGLLPQEERRLAAWLGPDVKAVLRFGSWRAAQQGVRPAMLTAMRTLVIVAAGAAVFGHLEAARVYVAPTMLIVNGAGAYLFASYASQRDRPLRLLLRRADVGAASLFGMVLIAGGAAVVVSPWAGPIITGGAFALDRVAILGWVVYAACAALLMPYGGLAAVAGMQAKVFAVRVAEAVLSLAAVAAVVYALGADVSWVPYALAGGAAVAGAFIRWHVVRSARAEGVSAGGPPDDPKEANHSPGVPAAGTSE